MGRRSIFDVDRDGKIDSIEMAAAAAFIEEIEKEENDDQINRAYKRKRTRKLSQPTGIAFLGKPVYDSSKDIGCLRLLIVLILLALPFPLMYIFNVESGSWGVALCLLIPAAIALVVLKNC